MPLLHTNPTAALAIRACDITGIPHSRVFSSCRSNRVTQIRFAAWHLARLQGWTLEAIAEPFDRDHATVIHGLRRALHLVKTDPWFRDLVQALSIS